jgi:hypothetical protein
MTIAADEGDAEGCRGTNYGANGADDGWVYE